jgi:anthranilate phosphoribosyltransferase
VAGRATNLREGVAIGTKSLDSGAALGKLKRLIAVSND